LIEHNYVEAKARKQIAGFFSAKGVWDLPTLLLGQAWIQKKSRKRKEACAVKAA